MSGHWNADWHISLSEDLKLTQYVSILLGGWNCEDKRRRWSENMVMLNKNEAVNNNRLLLV